MRLIAPWFFIAAALVTYAIGRGVSKLTAIFSSLFFLSTPLLFLGADSALIDSLTVCGFTLIIIFIIALKPTHPHFAVATGLVLGLSLWSHSQSILFIAITAFLFVLRRGFERKIQASILGLGLMLLIGLAIGSAPYINNYLIFKSFISDNPAVFALPSLDWSGYFEFARGIDNTIAKIQYGLFKGWFSLEAYGFVFWFWTLGLVLYIRTLASKSASEILKFGSNDYDICNRTLYVTFLCTVAYLAGVLLSILLGIDLMIKNERYMLVLVPLVSVGAAYFFSITINGFIEYGKSNGWKYDISSVLVCGLLVTLVLQIVIIGWHYRWRHVSTIDSDMSIFFPEQLEASDNHKNRFNRLLSRWSSMEAMQQLQDIDIKQGELVLSFRPADMYYTDIRMISYLDERLLPIYETSSVEAAYEELKRIGIRYVYLTDYTLPPYNHSVLMEILSNPSFSSLKFASGMFQIYELTPDVKQEGLVHDLTPGSTPWTNFWQLRLGGRKALSALSLTPDKQLDATSTSTIPFFHRDYSQVLLSGWGVNNNKHALNTYHAVNSKELLFNLMIQGRGFVTLWLIQLDSKGREIALDTTEANTALRLGDIILSEKYTKQLFSRRLLLNPDTEYVRFAIEHSGDSNIQVDKVSLIEIVRN
jgi:hypothetical protein